MTNSMLMAYRAQAVEAFAEMNQIKQQLHNALLVDERSYPAWIAAEGLSAADMRIAAYEALTAFHYEEGQDRRVTKTLPGLVAVGPETLSLARDMNGQKDRFQEAMVQIRKTSPKSVLAGLEKELWSTMVFRDPDQAKTLKRAGLARVNLLQAYRHIQLVDFRPLSVSFNPCQNITVKKTTLEDVQKTIRNQLEHAQQEERIDRLKGDLATIARSKLDNDSPLAIRRVYGKRWMVRIMQPNGKPDELPGHTPLLIPHEDGKLLPTFRPVSGDLEKDGYSRLERVDRRVAAERFIESLPVYRYVA